MLRGRWLVLKVTEVIKTVKIVQIVKLVETAKDVKEDMPQGRWLVL